MLLVDARGVPLSIVVTAANHHDVTQLAATLDAIVASRPPVAPRARQHLCADAGFVGATADQNMRERDYTPRATARRRASSTRSRQARAALGGRSGAFVVHALPQIACSLREDASFVHGVEHARRCHHHLPARARECKHYLRITSKSHSLESDRAIV